MVIGGSNCRAFRRGTAPPLIRWVSLLFGLQISLACITHHCISLHILVLLQLINLCKDTLIILIGTGETAFSVVLAIMSQTGEGGVAW